jgi:hypothetical protein
MRRGSSDGFWTTLELRLRHGSEQHAGTVEERANPQDEYQVIERPSLGRREPARDRAEVLNVPLAPEVHYHISAKCVDQKDIEDDGFDAHT